MFEFRLYCRRISRYLLRLTSISHITLLHTAHRAESSLNISISQANSDVAVMANGHFPAPSQSSDTSSSNASAAPNGKPKRPAKGTKRKTDIEYLCWFCLKDGHGHVSKGYNALRKHQGRTHNCWSMHCLSHFVDLHR